MNQPRYTLTPPALGACGAGAGHAAAHGPQKHQGGISTPADPAVRAEFDTDKIHLLFNNAGAGGDMAGPVAGHHTDRAELAVFRQATAGLQLRLGQAGRCLPAAHFVPRQLQLLALALCIEIVMDFPLPVVRPEDACPTMDMGAAFPAAIC